MATCSFPAPRRLRTEENSNQVSRTRVRKVAGVIYVAAARTLDFVLHGTPEDGTRPKTENTPTSEDN